LQQIREGRGLDPRVLDAEAAILGDDASDARDRHPAIALNFIHAADFDEAVKIAKGHPGLRYGVSIEVRPWVDPRSGALVFKPQNRRSNKKKVERTPKCCFSLRSIT